ncbi:MAG: hypothetical protein K9L24_01130 [Spirochaetia bacterium]|nr:hypothetical protein [Spirochaetia bacterium]
MAQNKVSVVIDGKEYISQEANKAGGSITKMGSKSKKAARAMKIAFASAAASVAVVVTGLTRLATKSAGTADRIDKMSQKIGVSRETFQELDFVLSQTGGSIESLEMGIKTLSNAAREAAKGGNEYARAYEDLGVTVFNENGAFKDQERLLNDTIIALSGMSSETERTAIASRLLGRSATDLAPLLNSGAESIEEMRQKAKDLGLVLGDDVIDAGVRFTDTMDQIKRVFQTTVARALGPYMDSLDDLGQKFIDKGEDFQLFIAKMIAGFSGFISILSDIPQFVSDIMSGIRELISNIFTQEYWLELGTSMWKYFKREGKLALEYMGNLLDAVGTIIWKPLKFGFLSIIDGIRFTFNSVINFFIDKLNDLMELAHNAGQAVAHPFNKSKRDPFSGGMDRLAPPDSLSPGWEETKADVKNAMNDIVSWTSTLSKSSLAALNPKEIFSSIFGDSLGGTIGEFADKFKDLIDDVKNASVPEPNNGEESSGSPAPSTPTGSGGSGDNNLGIPQFGMIGKVLKSVVDFGSRLGGMIGSLSSFQAIMDPIGIIFQGIMDILGPAIDSILQPIIGILRIFGQTIGKMLMPFMDVLGKVVKLLAKGFIWLYNKAMVPFGNFMIEMYTKVGNFFIKIINGIINLINKIPGVKIGKVGKLDPDKYKLEEISMADAMAAGGDSTDSSSYSGNNTGSNTSVQRMEINIFQYYNGPVIGEGGMAQVGEYVTRAIKAHTGYGGQVQIVEA